MSPRPNCKSPKSTSDSGPLNAVHLSKWHVNTSYLTNLWYDQKSRETLLLCSQSLGPRAASVCTQPPTPEPETRHPTPDTSSAVNEFQLRPPDSCLGLEAHKNGVRIRSAVLICTQHFRYLPIAERFEPYLYLDIQQQLCTRILRMLAVFSVELAGIIQLAFPSRLTVLITCQGTLVAAMPREP